MSKDNLLVKFPSVEDIEQQICAMTPKIIHTDKDSAEFQYVERQFKAPMMINAFITSLITQGKVITQADLYMQLEESPAVKELKDKQRKYWQARVYNRAWFSFVREVHLCAGLYKSLSYKPPMVYDEVIYNEVEDLGGCDVIFGIKGKYVGGKIHLDSGRSREFYDIKKDRARDFQTDITTTIEIPLREHYTKKLSNKVWLYSKKVIPYIEEQICLSLAT